MPDLGGEATRAVAYVAGGGVGLKLIEMLVKAFGLQRSLHVSELDATLKAAASIRDEQAHALDRAYARIRELENENAKLKDLNDKLDTIHAIVNSGRTRMLAHVALLTKHVSILLPADARAQFAAEVAKAELDDALANAPPIQAAPR